MSLARSLLIIAWMGACIGAGTGLLAEQARADDTDHVFLDAPGLLKKKPPPGLPEVKPQPTVWPRLDPGAVLCRSESDLERLAARRGGQSVSGPIDCQIIRAATGISILDRQGPGMVKVQTTDPRAGGVGWTDAWLPDKAPGVRAAAK
jgi:hypothetical protein